MYHPTSALRDTPFVTYMNSTRFGTEVPSSGFYYNKGIEANMPILCSVSPYKND